MPPPITGKPYQALVIGLVLQVGGYRRFWSVDSVMDRKPDEHNPIADAIELSPLETTDCFERRILHLPDDLGLL
jgi:hypothetical protein